MSKKQIMQKLLVVSLAAGLLVGSGQAEAGFFSRLWNAKPAALKEADQKEKNMRDWIETIDDKTEKKKTERFLNKQTKIVRQFEADNKTLLQLVIEGRWRCLLNKKAEIGFATAALGWLGCNLYFKGISKTSIKRSALAVAGIVGSALWKKSWIKKDATKKTRKAILKMKKALELDTADAREVNSAVRTQLNEEKQQERQEKKEARKQKRNVKKRKKLRTKAEKLQKKTSELSSDEETPVETQDVEETEENKEQ